MNNSTTNTYCERCKTNHDNPYPAESFEDWCIRVNYKLYDAQGVDGSKYKIMLDGRVIKV